MQFSTAILSLAAAISASASAIPVPNASFHVTGYIIAGGSGGTGNRFNVSASPNYIPGFPGFLFECGDVLGWYSWLDCRPIRPAAGSQVTNLFLALPEDHDQHVFVSHLFEKDGKQFNVTAGLTFVYTGGWGTDPMTLDLKVFSIEAE